MQTGEMEKKTEAWLHTNFLQQRFHCLSHVISEKPQSECCPVILPGDWAVRDIFSHAWPVHQQVSHSHSTVWLWCLSQLWILSDRANVAHRIMSSSNCLLFTSLSSRVKEDVSIRKEGYKWDELRAGKMAKVVKVDKVFAVQAWWSEFRPSEPTERLYGHGVAFWSAVNPASSRSSESPCLNEWSGEKSRKYLSLSLWFACVHTYTHICPPVCTSHIRKWKKRGKDRNDALESVSCVEINLRRVGGGGEFMDRNLILQPRPWLSRSSASYCRHWQIAHTASVCESAVLAAALLTESFKQHDLGQWRSLLSWHGSGRHENVCEEWPAAGSIKAIKARWTQPTV